MSRGGRSTAVAVLACATLLARGPALASETASAPASPTPPAGSGAAPATRADSRARAGDGSDPDSPLEAQRAVVGELRGRSVRAEAAFRVYAALARVSAARAATVSAQLRIAGTRLAAAEAQEAVARQVLAARVGRLRPRLLSLYRLSRRSPLEVLLPASDVATLVWRARALSTLVREDLAALDETRAVAEFQRQSLEQLDAWKRRLGSRLEELRGEAEEATAQEAELGDALQLLQARARAAGAVLAELGRARAQLDAAVSLLDGPMESSGFGALRGKLPLPAPGHVEVAFGRLVHPRFNTVTVQKGLDIRAPAGAPVRALAPGTVAWTGWMNGYGTLVIVDQGDGYHTLYAHLAESLRPVGSHVFGGEVLGTVGETGSLKGAYLYFEVRRRGVAVDPLPWVGASLAARGP